MQATKMSRKRTKKAPMSGKAGESAWKTDRRVVRTRDVLGDALVALMQEKPFESITVQHVLDRAGVSRSTFYEHYEDKNDLFLSDAAEFFEAMSTALSRHGDKSNRVAPVCEFFGHVAEQRRFHNALVASGKIQDLWEMGEEYFARGIEQRLAELPGVPIMAPPRPAALARAFAGALFSLLSWWIQRGPEMSATQMDELFHRMVWSSIGVAPPKQIEQAKLSKRFVKI
jgi:AcrR family transcriptional regulator